LGLLPEIEADEVAVIQDQRLWGRRGRARKRGGTRKLRPSCRLVDGLILVLDYLTITREQPLTTSDRESTMHLSRPLPP
jgi:hypothetical protein